MKLALLFPGQGSQQVGMGQDLIEDFALARATFEEADQVLGFSLSEIMWEGPETRLTETQNAQPALFVHAMAVFRVIQSSLGPVTAAAGHSLGELTAHAAAGSYSFAEGLMAVRRRGELMAEAGEATAGTMAAILGLGPDEVTALCDEGNAMGHTAVPANLNAEGQIVVSGDIPGISWLMEAAKVAGAKRVVALNVSGAFHSPLMRPAADAFAAHLAGVTIRDPSFSVVSNVTAEPVEKAEEVAPLLVRQLTSPVRWMESVHHMVQRGVDTFIEIGPGRVLTGLNKRNAPGSDTQALGTADSIRALEIRA